ncbi:hypothetical protein FSP39_007837 [Pinctada imbricata]|uniref:ADP-ribosylation factor-like protein 11 n=1 Tax=Pinctada imbricata TaxID=66713 RepID=A0AA88XPQ1_PINIB|nr:hypothetical protein FSP39_007837 [Pinctada imbricata]
MGGSSSIQLTMLGLDSAGKSTLLYRMKFDQYTNVMPTVSYNCEKIKVTSGKAKGITFTIWDLGGQDKKRPLWRQYTRSSDGIIFVVDSADKERLEEAKLELIQLLKCPDNDNLPILFIANKQDLRESLEVEEVTKYLGLHELNPGQFWTIMGSCAITGEGLTDAMDAMYELILKRKSKKKR